MVGIRPLGAFGLTGGMFAVPSFDVERDFASENGGLVPHARWSKDLVISSTPVDIDGHHYARGRMVCSSMLERTL